MLKQQPFLRSQVHGLIRSLPHQAPPIAGRASPCVHRLRRRQGPRPPCCRWAQPVARCRSALHASGWAPRGRRAARARRRRRWAPQGRRCRWARLLRRRQRMQRPVRLRACPLRCAVLQACARACIRSPRLHTPRDQASSWQYPKLRCHSQINSEVRTCAATKAQTAGSGAGRALCLRGRIRRAGRGARVRACWRLPRAGVRDRRRGAQPGAAAARHVRQVRDLHSPARRVQRTPISWGCMQTSLTSESAVMLFNSARAQGPHAAATQAGAASIRPRMTNAGCARRTGQGRFVARHR